MRTAIVLAPEALADLRALEASLRSKMRDEMERLLRHQPTKTSRSRIKRLRGLSRPQYRLQVGAVRVYYDIVDDRVEALAIVPKDEADEWLRQQGAEYEGSSAV